MLNESQLEIVKNAHGKSLVIAGPGSGKTRTIVFRVAELIKSGTPPYNILLLTFTNKAAREMKARVEKLLSIETKGMMAGTFHHFANRLVRRHAEYIGFTKNFIVLDENDSLQLIQLIAEKIGGKKLAKKARTIKTIIGLKVLKMCEFSDLTESKEIESVYGEYVKKCKELNVIDFNHLLFYLYLILTKNHKLRDYYNSKFIHILVDEYQDTDKLQNEILKLIAKNNLLVVGDDCQSIYSFRGADVNHMLEFPKNNECKIFKLEDNYRSTKNIVKMINNSIVNNKTGFKKELRTILDDGEKPVIYGALNTYEEARYVVAKTKSLMNETEISEIAVLFRASNHASLIELELTREKIPYVLRGGLRFFEKKHIKDLLAFLRIHINKKDELAWRRVLQLFAGIGKATAEKIILNYNEIVQTKVGETASKSLELIKNIVEHSPNPTQMLEYTLDSFYNGYMKENFEDANERNNEVKNLVEISKNYKTIKKFLDDMTLERKEFESSKQKLVLSTIHQAKGLEWSHVFLIGLAQGMFPMLKFDTDIEEERRLFYVAISRAKKGLYLSYPMTNARDGYLSNFDNQCSIFIEELPKDCYDFI